MGNSPKPSPSVDSDIEKVNHILKREGHPESRFSRGGNDPSHHRPTQAHHQSNYNNPSSRDPPYREYRDRQDPHQQPLLQISKHLETKTQDNNITETEANIQRTICIHQT